MVAPDHARGFLVTAPERIGRYRIVSEIGRGAMGVVYRGEDEALGRGVAIKTIIASMDVEEQQGYLARFRQEARALGGLNHPGIITVYEFGDQDGLAYLAMELLEGRELRDVMTAGRLEVAAALDIAAQMAEGLAFAHAQGIVHRDIKPANAIVTQEGFDWTEAKNVVDALRDDPLALSRALDEIRGVMCQERRLHREDFERILRLQALNTALGYLCNLPFVRGVHPLTVGELSALAGEQIAVSCSVHNTGLLAAIGRFYAFQSFGFFDHTSGILALMAAMFTISRIELPNCRICTGFFMPRRMGPRPPRAIPSSTRRSRRSSSR